MGDLLKRSVRLLIKTKRQADGVLISYVRGNDEVQLEAIAGQSDIEDMGLDNDAISIRADDWLIDADLLWINGVKILPKRGDKIIDGPRVFEVVQRGESLCYRWTDQTKLFLRVFTIEIVS